MMMRMKIPTSGAGSTAPRAAKTAPLAPFAPLPEVGLVQLVRVELCKLIEESPKAENIFFLFFFPFIHMGLES